MAGGLKALLFRSTKLDDASVVDDPPVDLGFIEPLDLIGPKIEELFEILFSIKNDTVALHHRLDAVDDILRRLKVP